MSFGAVFYLASVIGAYKLGFLTCKDPEAVSKWLKLLWNWMSKSAAQTRRVDRQTGESANTRLRDELVTDAERTANGTPGSRSPRL